MRFLLAAALAACLPARAHAASADEPSAAALLAEIDAALPAPTECEGTLTVAADGSTTTITYKLSRLQDKRFLVFLAPDDFKGTAYLVTDPNTVLVYLPLFGKVRRGNPDMLSTPVFHGSLLSLADLLEIPFAARWVPGRANEFPGGKSLTLRLKDAKELVPNLSLRTGERTRWINREARIDMFPLGHERRTVKEQVCAEASLTDADFTKSRLTP